MKTLAEFLERPAGETVIGFALMAVGAGFWACKVPKAEDIIVAGFTLVGRAMVGALRDGTPKQ
jgi:hypothetical protein